MSTLRVNTLQDQAGTGQPDIDGLCKAWVNFNGTGTVAIRASYNVSSITDNATGQYTVNMTNAMSDTDYCVTANGFTGSGGLNSSGGFVMEFGPTNTSTYRTTTAFQLLAVSGTNGDFDAYSMNVAVFR